MLHIYYGTGKGKTTAAMGLAVRMLGANKKVQIIQFLKDGQSSELKPLQSLGAKINAKKMPEMFIDMSDSRMIKQVSHDENELFDCIDDQCDLIILDELLDVMTLSLINEERVLTKIKQLKKDHEVVLTGRQPPHNFQVIADYSSQIVMKKHPYQKGIKGRIGIEF